MAALRCILILVRRVGTLFPSQAEYNHAFRDFRNSVFSTRKPLLRNSAVSRRMLIGLHCAFLFLSATNVQAVDRDWNKTTGVQVFITRLTGPLAQFLWPVTI